MTRPYVAIFGLIAVGLVGLGFSFHPAAPAPTPAMSPGADEKLFFACEVRQGSKLVARPKLVGVEGKPLKLYLTHPDSDGTLKLALELDPARDASGYRVGLNLTIPGTLDRAQHEIVLANGEEREVAWAGLGGPVTLRVMLMRVSSPEFKAYIDLGSRTSGDRRT